MKTVTLPAVLLLAVVALPWTKGLVLAPAAQAPEERLDVPPQLRNFIKPLEPAPGESDLRKKLKERHNAAIRLFEERVKDYKNNIRDIGVVFEAARLVVDAKLDLTLAAEARIEVLKQTLELVTLLEKRLQEQIDKGFGSRGDLERARYARLSVEIELLKAK